MTANDFVYWLQGWLELENPKQITERQVTLIKEQIKKVNGESLLTIMQNLKDYAPEGPFGGHPAPDEGFGGGGFSDERVC